ncbi:14375_t:CDS:2, partial [Gigaspora margarita]
MDLLTLLVGVPSISDSGSYPSFPIRLEINETNAISKTYQKVFLSKAQYS